VFCFISRAIRLSKLWDGSCGSKQLSAFGNLLIVGRLAQKLIRTPLHSPRHRSKVPRYESISLIPPMPTGDLHDSGMSHRSLLTPGIIFKGINRRVWRSRISLIRLGQLKVQKVISSKLGKHLVHYTDAILLSCSIFVRE
jgi:hypothetical protein